MKLSNKGKTKKNTLRLNYEKACNDYVKRFIKMYALSSDDFWVGEEVGGIVCVSDYFINFLDVVYMVDNNIGWDVFLNWYDYTLELSIKNGIKTNKIPIPNLQSWCMGCPRYSEDELDEFK